MPSGGLTDISVAIRLLLLGGIVTFLALNTSFPAEPVVARQAEWLPVDSETWSNQELEVAVALESLLLEVLTYQLRRMRRVFQF